MTEVNPNAAARTVPAFGNDPALNGNHLDMGPDNNQDSGESFDEAERKQILDRLARKVEDLFSKRANDRINKDGEWDTCLTLYHAPLANGDNYYSDKPFTEKPGRSRPTPNIVRTKVDVAIANSVSMQFAGGQKNWDIFPPADITDPETADRCAKMSSVIEAQLDACNYQLESRRAMEDRVILGTGIMKGPVNTGKLKTKFVKMGESWIPKATTDYQPAITCVRPWRFYPDMNVETFAESPDAIEYHPLTALDLSLKRRHPGFDSEAISSILSKEDGITADMYNTEYFSSVKSGVWSSRYMYKDRYTVLEYHGPITYDDVCKLGLDPTYDSPTQEYYGEVWVCCGKVIRMELENIEAQYETPYAVAVWKRDPTSPFGFGHPLLLADAQRVVTASYHMILDNASLTSGPQMSMYQQYIQPVDGSYEITPNKVWLLTDPSVSIKDAINFFTPTNVIGNILPVLQLARQFADEESATISPTSSPQNVDSATGQLIIANNSTTVLDFMAEEWDDQITVKNIRRTYAWNMQYNPREDIKGDYIVDVKSSSEYKNKQMYIRDMERLSVETTQNPAMAEWVNQKQLIKARLNLMHIPDNTIILTDDEHKVEMEKKAQQVDPNVLAMQIAQADAARADRELALQEQKLQFEMKQAQQREQWEHEEKMGSNYARVQEAQAQVIKAQMLKDSEMIKLAAKDKQLAMKFQTDVAMNSSNNDAKIFMETMRAQNKAVANQLTGAELQLAAETGEGI